MTRKSLIPRLQQYLTQLSVKHVGLLAGLVLLAFFLRLWGLGFGLPYTYHVDEPTYVSAALNLGAGRIGRQLNPPVLPNLLFIEYGFYYLVERITGNLSSAAEFENLYRTDPSVFFLLGRLTIAIMGTLNVLVVYMLGKKISSHTAGILAALFLSLAFLHVRDSHFAVPDVMMTLLISACILFCVLALESTHQKYLYVAAALAGMAIASKWSAWPVVIPLGFVFIFRRPAFFSKEQTVQNVVLAACIVLCLLVGFFLPAFQLIIKPRDYIAYALAELHSGDSGGFGVWQVDNVPGYIFYLKTLWYGVGVFILGLGILGLFRRIWVALTSRDKPSIVLVLFPLIYYIFMGWTRHYFARYALPIIPFLVLFAAEAIIVLIRQIEIRFPKWRGAALILLVLITIIQPLVYSLRFDYLMTLVDTRTIAKEWIEENIPVGSKIALDWPIHSPPLNPNNYQITIEGELGLANHPIEYYQQNGFDYLIASSNIYEIPLVIKAQDLARKSFYNSLNQDATLTKEFSPRTDAIEIPFVFDEIYGPFVSLWQRERPGPTLKIYKLSH